MGLRPIKPSLGGRARIVFTLLVGLLAPAAGLAMDSGEAKAVPPGFSGAGLARLVKRWETEMRKQSDRVQEARTAYVKERSTRAQEPTDGWAGSARADAAVLAAEANLREREAEAAMAQAGMHSDQRVLFIDRKSVTGQKLSTPQRALLQRYEQLEEKASGSSMLAFQKARALGVQAQVREAMAEAMERVSASGRAVGRRDREAAVNGLQAVVAACEPLLVALDQADGTVGVHVDFLEAQEAAWNRLLAAVNEQIETLEAAG